MNTTSKLSATQLNESVNQEFLSDLQQVAAQIEAALQLFLTEQMQAIPATLPHAQRMLQIVQDFCLIGGKRLRPYLVLTGYQLVGGKSLAEVLPIAVATELLHAFLLIHDDIMDQSPVRRGQPTVHTQYIQELKQSGYTDSQAQRYGESLGILAGDLCYALMLRLLGQVSIPAALYAELLQRISDTTAQTIYGQELDLRFERQTDIATEAILDMYRLKTAKYSFDSPLQLGLQLGKASKAVQQSIHQYAMACGVAFQIQDDILGLFGDEAKTGKSVTNDFEQGKRTILLAKALELSSDTERVKLVALMNEPEPDLAIVIAVRQIIQESGALAACQELARANIIEAKQVLDGLPPREIDLTHQQKLIDLAEFVMNREL